MDVSLIIPMQSSEPWRLLPLAKLAQQLGVKRLWTGQSLLADTHQIFSYFSGAGVRLPFGSAVALTALRHPVDAAVQARGVAALSQQPYVAGYGPGSTSFQAAVTGTVYGRPVARTGEFLGLMRQLLEHEVVEHAGDTYQTRFKLEPIKHPPVELGAGVLRPRMARGIARFIDVGITWMAPEYYIRDVLAPAFAEGVKDTGRKAPRVASVIHAAIDRPGRDRVEMAYQAASAHLSLPHYTDMLRRCGLDVDVSDPRAGAQRIVDHGVFVYGSADEVAKRLKAYREAGVSEIVINPAATMITYGQSATLRDVKDIVEACRAL